MYNDPIKFSHVRHHTNRHYDKMHNKTDEFDIKLESIAHDMSKLSPLIEEKSNETTKLVLKHPIKFTSDKINGDIDIGINI